MITVDEDDEISMRFAAKYTQNNCMATGVSRSTVHKISKKENSYTFLLTFVVDLLLHDRPIMLLFCIDLLNKHNNDSRFFNNLLFTDEASFSWRGVNKLGKNHSTENPHLLKENPFQTEF